jgi:acetylornithine deacetylase/succinyl-diaminopimelate desuccinylase-like protein
MIWTRHRVWLASALILLALAITDTTQAQVSAAFAASALLKTAPFLLLSIGIAAWAGATGADNLIARAFTGAPALSGEAGYPLVERISVRPTFDIHGIAGGFTDEGMKTVIPSKATAKLSMRLVLSLIHI